MAYFPIAKRPVGSEKKTYLRDDNHLSVGGRFWSHLAFKEFLKNVNPIAEASQAHARGARLARRCHAHRSGGGGVTVRDEPSELALIGEIGAITEENSEAAQRLIFGGNLGVSRAPLNA